MGTSVLRRNLKARVDSTNELISSSIVRRRRSRDSAELVSITVIAGSCRHVYESQMPLTTVRIWVFTHSTEIK